MKYSFTFSLAAIVLILIFGTTTSGQDVWVGAHNNTFYSIKSITAADANNAFATSTFGLIIKTTDAGVNWYAYPTGTSLDINTVHFVNNNMGWAAGPNESGVGSLLLGTTDGGLTWTRQLPPSSSFTRTMRSIYFHDASNGWVVGASGKVARTTNGGTNWIEVTSGATFTLYSVHFRDANNGYIVGGSTSAGYVLKTTDGGITWGSPLQISALPLYAVVNIDATTSVAVGNNGTIMQTTDDGATWNARSTPPGAFEPLRGMSAVGNTVFAAGDTVVIVSQDGGNVWTKKTTGLQSGLSQLLNDITMTSATDGWAVGDWGVIYRTTDGGNSWNFQLKGSTNNAFNLDVNTVHFVNNDMGWAAGPNESGVGSLLLGTTDGGLTWTRQLPPSSSFTRTMRSIYFHDASNGWVVGASGKVARTTNGGTNWIEVTSGATFTLYSVHFRDANNGYIVGGSTSAGYVLKTTDGGITWGSPLQISALPLYAVVNIDATTSVAVGNNGTIMQTTDDGATWNARSTPPGAFEPLRGMSAVGNTVFAAGDTVVIVSQDGGNVWTKKTTGLQSGLSQLLNDITMINASTGWVVGDYGLLYKTLDGGNNWEFQDSPYPGVNIKSISSTSELVYFGGVSGTNGRNSDPVVNVRDINSGLLDRFVLLQNYPNPFNPSTKIEYQIPELSFVTIKVFDVLGREIATIVNEEKPMGSYDVEFNSTSLPSGIYFYRIQAGNFVNTKKMILLK